MINAWTTYGSCITNIGDLWVVGHRAAWHGLRPAARNIKVESERTSRQQPCQVKDRVLRPRNTEYASTNYLVLLKRGNPRLGNYRGLTASRNKKELNEENPLGGCGPPLRVAGPRPTVYSM